MLRRLGFCLVLLAAFVSPGNRAEKLLAKNGAPVPMATLGSQSLNNDSKLKEQLQKLTEALNKRDLNFIRSQISPNRIYVEIADRTGAYLSNGQTLVVMETFFRTRTSIASTFDFVSDDGSNGSASGSLTARKDGRLVSYRLNFGFTKNDKGAWLLTRITMR